MSMWITSARYLPSKARTAADVVDSGHDVVRCRTKTVYQFRLRMMAPV